MDIRQKFFKYRYFVLLFSLAVFALLAVGLKNLSITNDFRVFFSQDTPQLKALESMEREFNREKFISMLLEPATRNIFTPENLQIIAELTEEAWQTPHSQRVNSLANYQHTEVQEDELVIDYLFQSGLDKSPAEIERIKKIALGEITLLHNLVDAQGTVTMVVITCLYPKNDGQANRESLNHVRELQNKFREKYPEVKISLAGGSTADVVLGETVESDLSSLMVTCFGSILICLIIFLRSWAGMILTFLVMNLSIFGAMGFFGFVDPVLTPVAGYVPSMVMTLSVADCVHLIATFLYLVKTGEEKNAAVFQSLKINMLPITITSLTTAAAMLCLNFSESPPYRALGNMVAVGAVLALFFTLTLVPALLLILPLKKGGTRFQGGPIMAALAEFVIKKQKSLVYLLLPLMLGLGLLSLKNDLTEKWFEYFDDTFEITYAFNVIDKKLSGLDFIAYRLQAKAGKINDPAYLGDLEKLGAWLKTQPEVKYVSNLADIVKRLHKNMHGDNPDSLVIPANGRLIAQYLFLYEMDLPQGLGLDYIINTSRDASKMTVVMKSMDFQTLLNIEARIQAWMEKNTPNIIPTDPTGLDVLFAHLKFRDIRSMITGSLIALLVISIILIFTLRSLKYGLVSLVPNLLPAAMAYGIWAVTNGEFTMAVSVIFCMTLGIVVDDTVHFLTKFLRARKAGVELEENIRSTFDMVGSPILITSIVLMAGFSALIFSHFAPTWQVGILMTLTVFLALVTDFLVLPAILLRLDKKKKV